MIIAQFYAQKELQFQPGDERNNSLLLLESTIKLQKIIRDDREISCFQAE